MTKLLQWLSVLFLFMAIWIGLLTENIPLQLSESAREVVLVSPVYLLIAFACYSLAVIGYRVSTFNDCTEAAVELKQEIVEARKDLKKRGFKFATAS